MSEAIRRPHAHNLVRWTKDRPEVLVRSPDLTSSCEAPLFRETYLDRFISLGMCEQNMISSAAVLAREGYHPYVHIFAVLICQRPFAQVATSVAYPTLPVRLRGVPSTLTPS